MFRILSNLNISCYNRSFNNSKSPSFYCKFLSTV